MGVVLYSPSLFFNYPQRVAWTVFIRAQCLVVKDTAL